MSAAVLVTHRLAPRAGRDLASGIFALPLELASGLSRSEPANDTGENGVAYDEVTSESCYWLSKDPIRFNGGVNLYAYAKNDPANFVDRTGRKPEDGEEGGSAESDWPESDNYDDDDGICRNDDDADDDGPLECTYPCDQKDGKKKCVECCDFFEDSEGCQAGCCGGFR